MNTFTKVIAAGVLLSMAGSAAAAGVVNLTRFSFLGPSVTGAIGGIPAIGLLLGGNGKLSSLPFFGGVIQSGMIVGIPYARGKAASSGGLPGLEGLKISRK